MHSRFARAALRRMVWALFRAWCRRDWLPQMDLQLERMRRGTR